MLSSNRQIAGWRPGRGSRRGHPLGGPQLSDLGRLPFPDLSSIKHSPAHLDPFLGLSRRSNTNTWIKEGVEQAHGRGGPQVGQCVCGLSPGLSAGANVTRHQLCCLGEPGGETSHARTSPSPTGSGTEVTCLPNSGTTFASGDQVEVLYVLCRYGRVKRASLCLTARPHRHSHAAAPR